MMLHIVVIAAVLITFLMWVTDKLIKKKMNTIISEKEKNHGKNKTV